MKGADIVWKATQQERDSFNARVERIFDNEISKQYLLGLQQIRDNREINLRSEDLFDAFDEVYTLVGVYFAEKEYNKLITKKAVSFNRAFFTKTMKEFVRSELAIRVQKITDTTRRHLQDMLTGGIAEGLSIPNIAKNIAGIIPIVSRNRAKVISRTEIVGASNKGSLMGAEKTELPLMKVWLATRDSRTRDSHSSADGQKVNMKGTFFVGGDSLRYPGDPAGRGSNIIQCRCTIVYEPEKE